MTLSELIDRYIVEMTDLGKPIGTSHLYTLRRTQRSELGPIKVIPFELKKGHIIEYCKARRKTVCPATVQQDITYLRGPLGYAGAAWDDCIDISVAPIEAAKPILVKYGLTGKSRPRDRRPTDEELERLLAYFREQSKSKKTKIPMDVIVEFSVYSARRISETCRLRWGDVNGADQTCIVRDMKDPKQKKGNDHEFPLLGRAWDIVMAQPRRSEDPNERIFPYSAKSCSQRYTKAKKALGIENLRLHDNRREAASRAFEGKLNGRKYGVPEVMVITGHKNPQMLIRTYTRLKAKDLHAKPADEAPKDAQV